MMEAHYGVRGIVFEDVFFTESSIVKAFSIQHIEVKINRQNSNLQEIKQLMSKQAKSIGANAIMNFRYGQKKHKWYELVFTFKWDTESWYGEGDAVKVS